MAAPFYFAWVEPEDNQFASSAHAVEDEDVVAYEFGQKEGEAANLILEIRNPRVGLLKPGRKRWAWFSFDSAGSGGITPLFFGRLIGMPTEFAAAAARLEFVARPLDFDEQKRALAETLKVAPYWDPVWITEEERDNPDSVLEARTQAWHVDPVTHVVSVSDLLNGEDGTLTFGPDDFVAEPLPTAVAQPPLRRVRIEAEVRWTQAAKGVLDLKTRLVAAFKAAGTDKSNLISSYTGDGLRSDWPSQGNSIGGGWEFGLSSVEQMDGILFEPIYKIVHARYVTVPVPDPNNPAPLPQPTGVLVYIQLYHFAPVLKVRYDVARERIEKLKINLHADVQALLTEPGEEEVLVIPLSSVAVAEEVDPTGSDGGPGMPIGDVRRRAYFTTDRGRRSVEWLIALARAELLRRARAVEVSIRVPLAAGLALSLRKNAVITDPRLPGGQAAGKITGYRLTGSGDSGEFPAEFTIACAIGQGNTVTATPGTPDYVEEGVLEPGIQHYTGQTFIIPVPGDVTYGDYDEPPADDGYDFFNLTADQVIDSFEVINGPSAQSNAVDGDWLDAAAVLAALKAVKTEVDIGFKPVDGGPFITRYVVPVSELMVPKSINLEAA